MAEPCHENRRHLLTQELIPEAWFIATVSPQGPQVDTQSSQTLLLALEMGGANWPSSCRNGSCRTCIGKLEQGSVRYDIEWPGLSREEIAEGYALPCVAYPCSNIVISPA